MGADAEDTHDDTDTDHDTPDPAPAPPAPTPKPAGASVSQNQLASIKARARAAGRREAQTQMEERFSKIAKALGFGSLEELENADESRLRRPSTATQAAPAPKAGKPAKSRMSAALERENARLLEQQKRQNRLVAQEARRRKQIERELAAKEAENELKITAIKAGVHDVDYAITILRRKLAGKTAEEISQFDEEVFFKTDLRKDYPYLYATEVVPANTSTASPASAAPKTQVDGEPTPATPTPPTTTSKDAKDMSREEYLKTLKQRGLNDPSVGMPG